MTADPLPSAAPPSALRVWANGSDIFLEIPGSPGRPPYIARYNYDARGLSLILQLLNAHRQDYDYLGIPVPTEYTKPSKEPGTYNQRAAAEALLRRYGAIK